MGCVALFESIGWKPILAEKCKKLRKVKKWYIIKIIYVKLGAAKWRMFHTL